MTSALGVLEGFAHFDGEQHVPHVRVAGDGERVCYLDLADSAWRSVEITPAGWPIVADPPVRMVRPSDVLPLPDPVIGGSAAELREIVNISDDEWPLLLGWIVAALRPRGPYPVLSLAGSHGSGKSSAARHTRAACDPAIAPLRAESRDAPSVVIAATKSWIIALDNLSHIALLRLFAAGRPHDN